MLEGNRRALRPVKGSPLRGRTLCALDRPTRRFSDGYEIDGVGWRSDNSPHSPAPTRAASIAPAQNDQSLLCRRCRAILGLLVAHLLGELPVGDEVRRAPVLGRPLIDPPRVPLLLALIVY